MCGQHDWNYTRLVHTVVLSVHRPNVSSCPSNVCAQKTGAPFGKKSGDATRQSAGAPQKFRRAATVQKSGAGPLLRTHRFLRSLAMENLLNFQAELDIGLLDHAVTLFFTGRAPADVRTRVFFFFSLILDLVLMCAAPNVSHSRIFSPLADGTRSLLPNAQVNTGLVAFQNHPDAWMRVDAILERSQSQNTKILALGILDNCTKTRCARARPFSKRHTMLRIRSFMGAFSHTPTVFFFLRFQVACLGGAASRRHQDVPGRAHHSSLVQRGLIHRAQCAAQAPQSQPRPGALTPCACTRIFSIPSCLNASLTHLSWPRLSDPEARLATQLAEFRH